MNNISGYISLYRSIRDHWLWEDRIRATWWLDILMTANYKPSPVLIDGKLIPCGQGQCVRSYYSWARMWNTNYSRARRFIKLLERERMISVENMGNRAVRITILRYNMYQSASNRLSDIKPDSYREERTKVESSDTQKVNQITASESNNYRSERINVTKEFEPLVNNEEVFNREKHSEKKSSVETNFERKFEMFLESEDAKKMIFNPGKQTPYDPTH